MVLILATKGTSLEKTLPDACGLGLTYNEQSYPREISLSNENNWGAMPS